MERRTPIWGVITSIEHQNIPITFREAVGSTPSKQFQWKHSVLANLSSIFMGVHLKEDLFGSIRWARLSWLSTSLIAIVTLRRESIATGRSLPICLGRQLWGKLDQHPYEERRRKRPNRSDTIGNWSITNEWTTYPDSVVVIAILKNHTGHKNQCLIKMGKWSKQKSQ